MELRGYLDALHATAEEGNGITEAGLIGTIQATKDVGAGISAGNRVGTRREVAAA